MENARCVHGHLRWAGDKGHNPRRLRGQEEKVMDMGTEAPGGISNVDFTLRLETKAQNSATLLPPQRSHTPTHVEVQVHTSDLLYKNPTFQNTQPHSDIKRCAREFPGSPVVRTPCFHCRGPGFDPWSGN